VQECDQEGHAFIGGDVYESLVMHRTGGQEDNGKKGRIEIMEKDTAGVSSVQVHEPRCGKKRDPCHH
jgi:hypothetical protein